METSLTKTNKQTMSSLEIAQIARKPHNDLLKAIRAMEPAWKKVTGGNFSLSEYTDASGRKLPRYELTSSECLYIAAKFNDETRSKLVVRLERLENKLSNPFKGLKTKMFEDVPYLPYRATLKHIGSNIHSGSIYKRIRRYPNEFRRDENGTIYASIEICMNIKKNRDVLQERRAIAERNPIYLVESLQLSLFAAEQKLSLFNDVLQIEDHELRARIAGKLLGEK